MVYMEIYNPERVVVVVIIIDDKVAIAATEPEANVI